MVIPEKRETNEVNPIIAPAYCLEGLHKEGKLRLMEIKSITGDGRA